MEISPLIFASICVLNLHSQILLSSVKYIPVVFLNIVFIPMSNSETLVNFQIESLFSVITASIIMLISLYFSFIFLKNFTFVLTDFVFYSVILLLVSPMQVLILLLQFLFPCNHLTLSFFVLFCLTFHQNLFSPTNTLLKKQNILMYLQFLCESCKQITCGGVFFFYIDEIITSSLSLQFYCLPQLVLLLLLFLQAQLVPPPPPPFTYL